MAKSIRSKVKKRHRTYMRKTVGEKVRSANISAAAARMQAKQRGRPNTKTLSFIKGALGGAGQVDLGKAYYEAVVRPARTAAPPSDDDDGDDMSDEEPAGGGAGCWTLPRRASGRAVSARSTSSRPRTPCSPTRPAPTKRKTAS